MRTSSPGLSEWVCWQDSDDSALVNLGEAWMCPLQIAWILPCYMKHSKTKEGVIQNTFLDTQIIQFEFFSPSLWTIGELYLCEKLGESSGCAE